MATVRYTEKISNISIENQIVEKEIKKMNTNLLI